jgi:hypothetical protein
LHTDKNPAIRCRVFRFNTLLFVSLEEKHTMKLIHYNFLIAHIKEDGRRFVFTVYSGGQFDDGSFWYVDKDTEPDTRDIFEEGECLVKFEGSFCWRGVWEGRLYFHDSEYWGEDLSEMNHLYNEMIVPYCKEQIKKRDPHNFYTP